MRIDWLRLSLPCNKDGLEAKGAVPPVLLTRPLKLYCKPLFVVCAAAAASRGAGALRGATAVCLCIVDPTTV
jgi:hypothetical protein